MLSLLEQFFQLQNQLSRLKNAPGLTDLVLIPTLSNAIYLLMSITPFITMRLISEEKQQSSYSLLMSSPIKLSHIIIGKYLASLLFFSLAILLLALLSFSLSFTATLDIAKISSALLALWLLTASFCAIGLYISCLSKQPHIAAISTFATLFMLWLFGSTTQTDGSNWLIQLSLTEHSNALFKGRLYLADIVFYISLILTLLGLSIRHLYNEQQAN